MYVDDADVCDHDMRRRRKKESSSKEMCVCGENVIMVSLLSRRKYQEQQHGSPRSLRRQRERRPKE